jgi:hypothetical protein
LVSKFILVYFGIRILFVFKLFFISGRLTGGMNALLLVNIFRTYLVPSGTKEVMNGGSCDLNTACSIVRVITEHFG